MRRPRRALRVILTLLAIPFAGCLEGVAPAAHTNVPMDAIRSRVRDDAEHVISTQYVGPGPAFGAFNDVPGRPTWVVPRENGVAILGLLRAATFLGGEDAIRYREAANASAEYLVRVQRADGAWADQYAYGAAVTLAASPTQTAEVLIALGALDATPARDEAVRRGAEWLLAAQAPANKSGPHSDDGLVNGGTGPDGAWYRTWRWASDNAFALRAFEVAAERTNDERFVEAAERVRGGIGHALEDPDGPAWHRRVDGRHRPVKEPTDWISYAPAFVGLPAEDDGALARWVEGVLGRGDGAVAWASEGPHAMRLSPGYAFQACAVWNHANATARCGEAIAWADRSVLRHPRGGWVDWVDAGSGELAPAWQRFVDTSAYAIAARLGERPFDRPTVTSP